jgi:hypothetical protein
MCIRLITRTVIAGGKRWECTATRKGEGVKLPATAAGTPFAKVFADLQRRYGAATADRLQNFLRFAEFA